MASSAELDDFLARLGASRERVLGLAAEANGPAADRPQLAAGVEELTGELLVADEELRAQHDELAALRVQIVELTARNEELFAAAPTAYLITDLHGTVIDANRSALRLFGDTVPRPPRQPIATRFPLPHRRAIRSLLSRAPVVGDPQSARVSIVGADGSELPVRVRVVLRTDPQSGTVLLRWEITPVPRSGEPQDLRLVSVDPDTGTAEAEAGGLGRLLSLARADLAAQLRWDAGASQLLSTILELTRRWVPGVGHASVCLHAEGRLHVAAATDELATGCDELQEEVREGPAYAAIVDQASVRVDDLDEETRWPMFSDRAIALGIRSVLVCELPLVPKPTATLNMYSRHRAAFGGVAELIAPVLAARASIALGHADQVFNLHRAVESRQVIGAAVGILMERHKLSDRQAFERMVAVSQNSHVKLRDIATRLVETGEEPEDVVQ